jgi:hypothetical protein
MEIELTKLQKEEILKIFDLIEEDPSEFESNVLEIMDQLLNREIINIWDYDLVDRYDEYKELVTDYLKLYLLQKDPPLKCSQCGTEIRDIEIQDISLMPYINGIAFVHKECEKEYEKEYEKKIELISQQIKDGTWY